MKHLGWLVSIYILVAMGYAIYSIESQTGLGGYLMGLQLDWFGTAYEKATMILAMAVLSIPGVIAVTALRKTGTLSDAQLASASPKDAMLTWPIVIGISVVPLLIAAGAYFHFTKTAADDMNETVHELNLNSGQALPAGAKFVKVTAVLQRDFIYQLERKSGSSTTSVTSYIPLTSAKWKKTDGVSLFVGTGITAFMDMKRMRQVMLGTPGPAEVDLEAEIESGRLPTFVVTEFERAGLHVISPHYVLKPITLYNGKVPDRSAGQLYFMMPVLGGFISLMLLAGLGIGMTRQRKQALRLSQDFFNK